MVVVIKKIVKLIALMLGITVSLAAFTNFSTIKESIQFYSAIFFQKVQHWSNQLEPHSKIITALHSNFLVVNDPKV